MLIQTAMKTPCRISSERTQRKLGQAIALFLLLNLFCGATTVSAQVNLSISVIGVSTADPGDEITYIVRFANTSSTYANNVQVTLNLPLAGLYTYSSSTPSGLYNSGTHTVTWTSAQVPFLAHLGAGMNQFLVKVRTGTMGAAYHPLWNPAAYYMPDTVNTMTANAFISCTEVPIAIPSNTVTTTIHQFCDVQMHDMEGEIKSSTNSVVVYLMNLVNTGNISDNYGLAASEAPGSQVVLT